MHTKPRRQLVSLLLAHALCLAPLLAAQDSRPRRVPTPAQPATRPAETPKPADDENAARDKMTNAARDGMTNADADAARHAAPAAATLARLDSEPTVRVGLTTSARAVNISTTGQLLLTSNEMGGQRATPAPVAASRVRVEPRLLGPQPRPADEDLFRVEVADIESEAKARSVAREARELTKEAAEATRDPRTGLWRVRVGSPAARADAEELRARLEEAGVATFALVNERAAPPAETQPDSADAASAGRSQTRPTNTAARPQTRPTSAAGNPSTRQATAGTQAQRKTPANSASARNAKPAGGSAAAPDAKPAGGLRLASRAALPTRGLVVYAGGASQLLSARAPVTFAAADEQNAPLRFNEKPYRGRLEVFTNTNGSLTVVNVVALEDYVRGVVPNELSPGGWPALEALKAQAVAARTYAVSNRGQFGAAGFDLLPTIRSQVYGGKATEHPLSTRAVEETRGVVAVYAGRPINALYTSTCGGHTEDGEKIFGGDEVPYLRGRACAHPALMRGSAAYALTTLHTSRELPAVRTAEHARAPRDLALLTVHGLRIAAARPTDDWLEEELELDEARRLLDLAAQLARRPTPALVVNAETLRPPAFATALAHALDGESRAAVLLDPSTVEYLLSFRDAADIPARHRADVALLLRDGHLALHPDATLRPRQTLTRASAFRTVASLFEARGLFNLQKATVRPTTGDALVVRGAKGPERTLDVAADAHLFRAYAGNDAPLYAVRTLPLVGGEPLSFHADARGRVDYLEARPAPAGAAAERFSPFTNWTVTLTPAEVAQRLGRHSARVGALADLRVAARGVSGRALDLEIVGAAGTAHVRGGRIRSALGLREQLFFVERRYDEAGRVAAYVFTGRGFGHGVGLCQVGAYGLARAGLSHEQILKHYYTGIELAKMY